MPVANEGEVVNFKKRGASDMNVNHAKKKRFTPDSELRFKLDKCSRDGDIQGALDIYDKSRKEGFKLNQYHFNVLLYLCSSAALGVVVPGKSSKQNENFEEAGVEDDGVLFRGNMASLVPRNTMENDMMQLAQKRGLEIYEQMKVENVTENEAVFTALARLAVAKRDAELAFSIVKNMVSSGISPKLRSYGPALYTCFKNNDADKAFEVVEHMRSLGVKPEEMELQVLLELSSNARDNARVYEVLHALRKTVREVHHSTGKSIEKWFHTDTASREGGSFTVEQIQKSLYLDGGGGHELGWIGEGKWRIEHGGVDADGVCKMCNEKLAKVDINLQETDNFVNKLVELACQKERNPNVFRQFQGWLEKHGPFDTVVDGANVALYNQNFAAGGFSFPQLNSVVCGLKSKYGGKLPLVILHKNRVTGGPASTPLAQQLLNEWNSANTMYTVPTGSNDDWYWIYAAAKNRCLLISNDEMRDHIFQLLGNDFFPRWKERHQVRFGFTNSNPDFHMPPPYSTVIQETERGSWHVPVSRSGIVSWLCISRQACK